jgi:hypothetical protein
MSFEGVLAAFLTGTQAAVGFARAFGIQPEEFDVVLRLVDEGDLGFLARPAGTAWDPIRGSGFQDLLGGRVRGDGGGVRGKAPAFAGSAEDDRLPVVDDFETFEGKRVRADFGGEDLGGGARRGDVIEEGFPHTGFGVDEHEFVGAGGGVDAVPEPGAAREPFGAHAGSEDGILCFLGEGGRTFVIGLGPLGSNRDGRNEG